MKIKMILLICIGSMVLWATQSFALGGRSAYTRSIKKSYVHGVELLFQETQQDATGAVTFALNPQRKRTAITTVQNAMQKYPVSILTRYIDRVIISNAVFVNGHRIGGMVQQGSRTMYLTLNNAYIKRYDFGLADTFHHEFAHVLTMAAPQLFDNNAWAQALPANFKYGGSSLGAIANQPAAYLEQQAFAEGFIKNYSKSNQQEDIATMAELLFTPSRAGSVARRYPFMRHKLMVLKQFYLKLHPEFSHYLK